MSATSRPGIAWHSGRRWIKPLALHQVRAAKVTFWSLCITDNPKKNLPGKFRAKASVRSCKMMVRKKDRFSELFDRPRGFLCSGPWFHRFLGMFEDRDAHQLEAKALQKLFIG